MKDKGKIILIVAILAVAAVIAYICYGNIKGEQNPVATMEVSYKDKDGNEKTGVVKMELYPDVAPESVANFIALANNGFYDGLKFHRIEKDFCVQGGDKEGTGAGSGKYSDIDKSVVAGSSDDYTYTIKGEFAANGVNNPLKFAKGVVGMARSDYSNYGMTQEGYNSGSTQFFITTTDEKASINSLNQNYASFGKVIEGYDIIEEISEIYGNKEENSDDASDETNKDSSEENKEENKEESKEESETKEEDNTPKMVSVKVDTFGAKYKLPNAINFESTLSRINQLQNYYQNMFNQSSATTEVGEPEDEVVE